MRSSLWMTTLIVLAGVATAAPGAISAPTDLSGLTLWLDANDIDGDGTSEGLGESGLTGSGVNTWTDKSATGSTVTQGTAGNQPLTGVNTFNGFNTITFDGGDDFLAKTGGALPLAAGDDTFTYFVAWKPDVQKLASIYEQSESPQAVGTRSALLQIGGVYGYNGEANDAHIVPYAAGVTRISGITSTGSGSPNILIDDNGSVFTATINNTTQNVGTTGIRVGNKLTNNGENFDGDVAEILVYDRNLSLAERSAVSGYLNSKYAVYSAADPSVDLLHQWTFNGNANDSVGTAHGSLFNGASVVDGMLHLDGENDYFRSATIDEAIGEKTLVAWVKADNLVQRSGGVLTLENPTDNDVFDSIVYGERTAAQWMNGSNNWQRSNGVDNGGATESSTGMLMMAITYYSDNSIAIYRDGELYATYVAPSLINYPAGIADVLMGVRHSDLAGGLGTATGDDAFFAGWIDEARIYGAALSADQIGALFAAGTVVPTPAALPAGFALIMAISARRRRR